MLPAPFVPQVRYPEIPEPRTPAPGNSSQDTLRQRAGVRSDVDLVAQPSSARRRSVAAWSPAVPFPVTGTVAAGGAAVVAHGADAH
jgi:hypothetical protein